MSPSAELSAVALLVGLSSCKESEQKKLAGRVNRQLDAEEGDRTAQSSLRDALTAAKAIYTDHETYRDVTVDEMSQSSPSEADIARLVRVVRAPVKLLAKANPERKNELYRALGLSLRYELAEKKSPGRVCSRPSRT